LRQPPIENQIIKRNYKYFVIHIAINTLFFQLTTFMKSIQIRQIQINDNQQIASIIREVLTEYGGNMKGTAYYDSDTDNMSSAYKNDGQIYFVALLNDELVGGCGIQQLKGDDATYCELQKLYILKKARGLGVGKMLTEKCLQFAENYGYKFCYLETLPNMIEAQNIYLKFNFQYLSQQIGNTGHNSCNVWMLKKF